MLEVEAVRKVVSYVSGEKENCNVWYRKLYRVIVAKLCNNLVGMMDLKIALPVKREEYAQA